MCESDTPVSDTRGSDRPKSPPPVGPVDIRSTTPAEVRPVHLPKGGLFAPGTGSGAKMERELRKGSMLCEILVRNGWTTAEAVDRAISIQEERGGQIGRILVSMGACSEEAIARALIEQLKVRRSAGYTDASAAARKDPDVAGLRVLCRPWATSLTLVAVDIFALVLSAFLGLGAHFLRTGHVDLDAFALVGPVAALSILMFAFLELYSPIARGAPDEIRAIVVASTLLHLGAAVLGYLGNLPVTVWGVFVRTVWWLSTLFLVPTLRAVVRDRLASSAWWGIPVVVLGAAKTGRLVVRTLKAQPRSGLKPVLLLDDDPKKQGTLRASFTNEALNVYSVNVSPGVLMSESTRRELIDEILGPESEGAPSSTSMQVASPFPFPAPGSVPPGSAGAGSRPPSAGPTMSEPPHATAAPPTAGPPSVPPMVAAFAHTLLAGTAGDGPESEAPSTRPPSTPSRSGAPLPARVALGTDEPMPSSAHLLADGGLSPRAKREVKSSALAPRGKFAEVDGVPVVGDLSLAPHLAEKLKIPYAIVAMPGVESLNLLGVVERVGGSFSHLLVIPDLFGFATLGVPAKSVGGILGVEVRQQLLLPWPRITKRALDVVLTGIGSLFVLPFLLFIALLIKLDSKGPVFYNQKRLGRDGDHFLAYKFRTMHGDGEERLKALLESDPALRAEYAVYHKLKNDPRVTRVGRILRKFSLDEFPQLISVLKGDMSLVGPRPYIERELPEMGGQERIILRATPGMTGMWQVSDRNAMSFAGRVEVDVHYVRNWSPWLDIYILARTFGVVIRGTGS